MTRADVDLDAYLARVQWGGRTDCSYETLAGLVAAHVARIPFENLDVLLKRPIRLDLARLEDKLVRRLRGGYCFEHVTLFAAVLERLGFAPIRHTARVVRVVPRTEAPRTHMLLTVPLPQGVFIVDPGFGSGAPRTPVPLREGVQVRVGDETHWLTREDGHWVLHAHVGDTAFDCWATTLESDNLVDFELGNHYTSTHPASNFVNRLMLRAYTPSGRVGVMNRDVTESRDGTVVTRRLQSRAELRELVARVMGVDCPKSKRCGCRPCRSGSRLRCRRARWTCPERRRVTPARTSRRDRGHRPRPASRPLPCRRAPCGRSCSDDWRPAGC
jgi:N-hydroxyarylamine O-acetyltransferase